MKCMGILKDFTGTSRIKTDFQLNLGNKFLKNSFRKVKNPPRLFDCKLIIYIYCKAVAVDLLQYKAVVVGLLMTCLLLCS